jgi:cell wall-associated NlpC family hydrolase
MKNQKIIEKPFRAGDIIVTNRILYRHYGIYAGNGRIIHYGARNGDFGEDVSVQECSLKDFSRGSRCFRINETQALDSEHPLESLGRYVMNLDEENLFGPLLAGIGRLLRSPFTVYSPEETVKRAHSRFGERKYHLIFNNCEDFALWCKTGIAESSQVNDWVKTLAALTFVLNELTCPANER